MASKSTENGNLMTNEMQCAVHTCKIHTSEVKDMYCSTCKQPHCLLCIKEKHISHDWDRLSKIAKTLRDEIPSKCQTVRETTVVRIQDYLDEIRDKRLLLSEHTQEKISRIKRQKEKILSVLDSKTDEMISNLNRSVDVIDKKLDSMESLLGSHLTDVRHFVDILEQNRLAGSDNVIIELADKLDVRIDKGTLRPNTQNLPSCPDFVEGKLNVDQLERMIGSIETEKKPCVQTKEPPSVKVSEKISDFKRGDKEIFTIRQTDDASAWILQHGDTKVEMLTLDGKQCNVQKHLKTAVDSFVISKAGDFIYTAYNNCSINKLSKDGEISTVLDSLPLHPKALHLCQNNELLVSLVDDNTFSDNKENVRIIRRITMSGCLIFTYQYEKSKNTKLFTVPISVFENYNSDICVVDRTELKAGQLCVLLNDGTIKFRYTGQKTDPKFCPLDVTCDQHCNIILSDWHNNCIHLLSSGGEFLKFLVTDKSGLNLPRSLCLYKKKLWVGCHYGIIKLYEYLVSDQ